MFGFVLPMRGELKVREWERFQSVYCGLCHSIRSRYGLIQTALLSYDCTYLALVLDARREGCASCRRRCITHPFRKRRCAEATDGIRHAAAVSVILNYHKVQDTIADERGIKRFGARMLSLLLRRGYKRARQDLPEFDSVTAQKLRELAEIERAQTPSLDIAADAFAKILQAAAPQNEGVDSRILGESFYHLGRWIYLVDSCSDIEDDFKSGSYNPVKLRYKLDSPDISGIRGELRHTLLQSLAASYHAYILLDIKKDSGIIENILCCGLPEVTEQVLNGTFQNNGGRDRNGSI